MDTRLLLAICLGLNTSRECIGIPKFTGVCEIDDFKQAKAENSDEN